MPKNSNNEKINFEKNYDYSLKKAKELFETKDYETLWGLICEFEKYLDSIKTNSKELEKTFLKDDVAGKAHGRWLDHKERDLFRLYIMYGQKESEKGYDGANKVIESMIKTDHNSDGQSRQGRIDKLSKEIEVS